jgi:predicted nucleic acid-binding protein
MSRVFLDANVLVDGIASQWSMSRAVLTLCAPRVHRLVLAAYVQQEVETSLLTLAVSSRYSRREATRLLDDYLAFLNFAAPQMVEVKPHEAYLQQAQIIRHLHDVPVLAAALKSQPDWVVSLNRKHFSNAVAQRTGLQIGDPLEFFRATTV